MDKQIGRTPARQVGSPTVGWYERLKSTLIIPQPSAQGLHLDPLEHEPPNLQNWAEDQKAAWFSSEMNLFRECLRIGDLDVRVSVLDDLSNYYRLSAEECRLRCLRWEEWSVREWQQDGRSTREGLQAFYDSVQSWSFDLLWYAYLQTCGYGFCSSVEAARFAAQHCVGGKMHLDFGSGVGVTSQLFSRLGFASTLADVSKSLLDFACWRLARRGDRVEHLLMTSTKLPTEAYDIVTALDTLTHVPDFDATARDLHRIIRPSGWLLANFDVRKRGVAETAWHLYDNAIMLEHRLQRAGFARKATLGGVGCYQRVEPNRIAFRARALRDKALLPFRLFAAYCSRVLWPTPRRVVRLISHVLGRQKAG